MAAPSGRILIRGCEKRNRYTPSGSDTQSGLSRRVASSTTRSPLASSISTVTPSANVDPGNANVAICSVDTTVPPPPQMAAAQIETPPLPAEAGGSGSSQSSAAPVRQSAERIDEAH